MKSTCFEYYPPDPDFYEALWKDCTFVFDANVLLNLYKYSRSTSKELLRLIDQLGERVWIPHQVAREYLRCRRQVILTERRSVANITRASDEAKKNIIKALALDREGGSFFDVDSLATTVETAFAQIEAGIQQINQGLNEFPDIEGKDEIRDSLERLFDGRIGEPWDTSRLLDAYDEAERRLAYRVPPGFEDTGKSLPERYGDVVLWEQVIEFANRERKSILFVTAETKSDWWLRNDDGTIVGPRTELRREMHDEAGVDFHMYRVKQFINQAMEFCKTTIKPEAVEEVADAQAAEDEAERKVSAAVKSLDESRMTAHWLQSAISGLDTSSILRSQLAAIQGLDTSSILRSQLAAIQGLDTSSILRSQLAAIQGLDTSSILRSQLAAIQGLDTSSLSRLEEPGETNGGESETLTDGSESGPQETGDGPPSLAKIDNDESEGGLNRF